MVTTKKNFDSSKIRIHNLYVMKYKDTDSKVRELNIFPVIRNGGTICCLVDFLESRAFRTRVMAPSCIRDNLNTYQYEKSVRASTKLTNLEAKLSNISSSSSTTTITNAPYDYFPATQSYDVLEIVPQKIQCSRTPHHMCCMALSLDGLNEYVKRGSIISIVRKSKRVKASKIITTSAYTCAGWCGANSFSSRITDIKQAYKLRLIRKDN